jgi:hypothetical protein
MSAPVPPPDESRLLAPLRRVLRPLVRLLIRNRIPFPVLADQLRGLYIEVAVEEAEAAGQAATDSRINLLTGVHRKELRRLRAVAADAAPPPPAPVRLASQVIARWLGDPAFTLADGTPRPLPRQAAPGTAPGFEELVSGITTDLRPRTVLDDFLAQGLVAPGPDGLLRLRAEAFLPPPGSAEQLHYFARNLHDHLAAAAANIEAAGTPPFLERSLHYDGLSPLVAAELEMAGRAAAQQLLLDLNRTALALLARHGEAAAGTPTRRVNIGVYGYAEDEPPEQGR